MDFNEFNEIINAKKPIHICGINGVSMRALAKQLCSMGAVGRALLGCFSGEILRILWG